MGGIVPMLSRTRLAQQSDKRRAESAEYARAKQRAFDRDKGQCQAKDLVPHVACAGRIDPHHVAPQGRYPELRCDVDNIRCVCRRHHDWIGDHPLDARELGLLT